MPQSDRPAVLAGLELRRLRPASSSGSPVTKVGRLSLRGELEDGTRIKVVEAHDAAHAHLIRSLAETSLAGVIPPVLGVEGRLVISRWVEADTPSRPMRGTELAVLLARIHATPAPRGSDASDPAPFDAWQHHVLPRARRAASALGRRDDLEALLASIEPTDGPADHVLHPDLTPANVLRSSGSMLVVDNELIGVGTARVLDLANLARGLDHGRAEVRDAYLDAGGPPPTSAEGHNARVMWLARLVGSWFVAGRPGDAQRLLRAGIGDLRLPFEQ